MAVFAEVSIAIVKVLDYPLLVFLLLVSSPSSGSPLLSLLSFLPLLSPDAEISVEEQTIRTINSYLNKLTLEKEAILTEKLIAVLIT